MGVAGLALGLLLPASTWAQGGPRPELRAKRLASPPTIDGDVLGESLWRDLDVATGFVQVEPFEGEPASERTEVRVAFDDRALYIAVVCFDGEADTLSVSDSRRDADLDDEDSFLVILDTFHDLQNGLVFGTNLAGIQYDAQVTNQGQGGGGGRGGGRGGAVNRDWDTSWEVRSLTGDFGWSAEMAIPFRSLRFASDGSVWGMNFERNIRRKSEKAYWSPLGRQFNLYRVSAAGTLVGVETPKQRNLQVVPYALAEGRDDGVTDSESEFDAGLDVKYGITNSLTLDLTINTDFAQVEVDDQQVNLDRFNLFFPEKRPFFLENAGLFRVGGAGGGGSSSGIVELFFSRRIGIDDDGTPVPIIAGARVSGRAAGLNLGVLAMQTDEFEGVHGDNFAVARVSKELANRSRVGLIAVDREGVGSLAPDDATNQTYGLDGQVGIGEFADLSGFVAKTETPGLRGRDHAMALNGNFSSPAWRWRAGYQEVGEDFNPEVGFVARDDYRRLNGFVMRRFRPTTSRRIKELGPRFFYDSYWNFDGFHETERYSLGGEIETRSGAQISLSAGGTLEGLQEPFEIFEGVVVPVGNYRNNGFFMFFNTSRAKAVSFAGRVQGGGFFNGNQLRLGPSLNFRIGEFLSSELSWQYNDIDLDTGAFETNLGRLRVTYAFSTELLLQALVQYNDVTDDVSTNLRFSWLRQAGTGLFLVYNEIQEFGSMGLPDPDRTVILKYSHLFDVFR